ncbi:IncF plasmid conjugative transfer mating signal transduction protein TraM [Klebsiella pneumoniae IS22]|nr:IncF plasmid conjugative transfer mating signal transduction protein TraM [Klebsiella pneumoniae IS22]
MERKDSGFNQTEFNKILLENVMKTQFTVSKLLAIGSLSLMLQVMNDSSSAAW